MRFITFIFIFIVAASPAIPQSGRTPDESATAEKTVADELNGRTVKELFEDANGYSQRKFAEFQEKKIPYSDVLLKKTETEKKQLAAKYALSASQRANLSAEDLYYVGLLFWVSENQDRTFETFAKYLESTDLQAEKAQTARSLLAVIAARRDDAVASEKYVDAYYEAAPKKRDQQLMIDKELAAAYRRVGDLEKAAPRAESAYKISKMSIADSSSKAKALDELVDNAVNLFEIREQLKETEKADATLEDLAKTGVSLGSPSIYFYAKDKLIKYNIETGRKAKADDIYKQALFAVDREFTTKAARDEATARLKRREKQYALLGTPAIELSPMAAWFPGTGTTIAEQKGKVVMLDFWATWCGPCLEAFPELNAWNRRFKDKGFVLLGLTRFYGHADGDPMLPAAELEYLKDFKKKFEIEYDTAVANNQTTQRQYAATSLPTAVLIDRKGIIRYLESGTSETRLAEMLKMIEKLIEEKE